MRTAIATVCLPGTLTEKLEAIAGARFTGIEIFENDLLSAEDTPAAAGRRIRALGLTPIVLQPFRDFEGMPEPQRAKAFARAERKFDLMAELGCDLLMICSNVAPDSVGGIDRAAADFRELGERAAKRGMRVAFEALAWGRHINDYRDAWEVVRRADHPAVGLVLDTFHILARGTDLTPIRSIPSDRIFLVQIADAPKLDMDYLSWSRHYRCFPGQGDLAIGDFMAALQATGFDGLLSLEIFSDRFRAGSARSVAIDGQRSLLFTLDRLRKRTGIEVPEVPPLPIPENYYGDLEARTDLTEDQTARLRAAKLLYDCERGAEFFHVYTRTLPGGFFFEIVERRGYRGFGAANAPIQLAAQARLARDTAIVRD